MKMRVSVTIDQAAEMWAAIEDTKRGLDSIWSVETEEHQDRKAVDFWLDVADGWVLFHLGQAFEVERRKAERKR